MVAPSGRQVVLVEGSSGGQQAVVVEVGGGLRRYSVGGTDVLDGFGEGDMASGGRGQPLLPWPNRLADGRYEWQGSTYQLAVSEPATSTAIHGLTRWQAWEVAEQSTTSTTMAHSLAPHPGYPWRLDASVTYRLDDEGLTVVTEVVNLSPEPAPFGLGFHPYLSAGGGLVDDCTLTVPAATALEADERGLPSGRHPVDGTDDDFRSGRRIGGRRLDLTLTDLPDTVTVRLDRPDGTAIELWAGGEFRFVQVFSGDTVADAARRRRGLAVEPMTGPADLLASGEGRLTLDPGEPWSGAWGVRLLR